MRFPARPPVLVAFSLALGLSQPASAQTEAQPGAVQTEPGHRTAVWIRPPNTAQALEQTLVAAKQAGFTEVLLEGFYHGRTIWSSELAPMKLNYDALAVADTVSRREGLGLNVWFETLYWRPDASFGIPVTPLWKDRYATLSNGGRASLELSRLGFVDPSDPEVGDLLAGLTAELGRLYPQVGLHLDYLRYPREAAFGYHPAALAAFTARTGLDALHLQVSGTPKEDAAQNEQAWQQFRRDQITALAGRLIASYRSAGGRGLVSAAVFGRTDPLQDWRSWPGLEVAMPMLYYPVSGLYRLLPFQFAPGENLWPGVQVGAGNPPLADQLALLHRLGYPNAAVFGWTPDLH